MGADKIGKAFDLLNPQKEMVDFTKDVGPMLSRQARFVGATQGDFAYSVCQHCVLGAEAIYAETDSARLALLFVLHDAHEFILGDITTPVADALCEISGPVVRNAIRRLKHGLDVAIHAAAGVSMPTQSESAILRTLDLRMLKAERDALMVDPPKPWDVDSINPELLAPVMVELGDFQPWTAYAANTEWLEALDKYTTWAIR